MNRVSLIGRLTKDPELKYTANEKAVVKITLAVNRKYKGDGHPNADFIPVVIWGKGAENTAKYMSKGKLMGIGGRIETRSYEAQDGTMRYITEVIAEDAPQFLEWGEKKDVSGSNTYEEEITPIDDGDIPF